MRRIITILLFSFFAQHTIGQEVFYALNQQQTITYIPFITEWVIPSNSYTLTLTSGAGTGSNYTVDWGDGTVDNHTTAATSHVYALSGTYDIQITGVYKAVNFASKSELRKILQWGDIYCTSFSVGGSGLTTISATSSNTFFSGVTSLSLAFTATGLTSIPPGLLNSAAACTNFQQIFYNCLSLTDTIPAHLLDKCVAATNLGQLFRNCPLTGTIPIGFFDYNVNATTIANCFQSSGIGGAIPTGLLDNLTSLTDMHQFVYQCTNITSIPSTLCNNNTLLSNLSQAFYGCSGVTSAVPELWNLYPSSTHTSCFTGCTNASNYASIPSDWK